MDLLLYLIRENEVDIYDIPIADITSQFVSYLELMEAMDLEYAAEFLVMAATLMDIKARMLVPQAPVEGEEDPEDWIDPREELVRELLEYKKFHDAALYLGDRYEERSQRFESGAPIPELAERPIEEIEVWDLFSAFASILKQIGAGGVEIVASDIPIETYVGFIIDRLGSEPRVAFEELFADAKDRPTLIGMFIALLELVRLRRIRAFQDGDFGRITLELRADAPAAPVAAEGADSAPAAPEPGQ